MKQTFLVRDVDGWDAVAARILEILRPGDVLLLSGPLGAGKTTFTQALARALGGVLRPRSPTFALVRAYPVKGPRRITRLVHIDAYRLETPEEAHALGLEDELLTPGTVLAIEWPEKIALPAQFSKTPFRLTITPMDPSGRVAELTVPD